MNGPRAGEVSKRAEEIRMRPRLPWWFWPLALAAIVLVFLGNLAWVGLLERLTN